MGNGRLAARRERLNKKRKQKEKSDSNILQELCERCKNNEIIPIISNSVRFEQIFDVDGDGIIGASADEDEPIEGTIENQLAEFWADEITYPFNQQTKLAQVAQYNRVLSPDDKTAKKGYLRFLKHILFDIAGDDNHIVEETIEELEEELSDLSFTELCHRLGYPHFTDSQVDPLMILAKLDLPIYVTTSPFEFMEQALISTSNGVKKPHTKACAWHLAGEGLQIQEPIYQLEPEFTPTPEKPLVYHLYGLESHPESMVLSEDDYLDFLARISRYDKQKNSVIPNQLNQKLCQETLLVLGYRLPDWEFKILFRGIINPKFMRDSFNLTIQLNPAEQVEAVQEAQQFLTKYFEPKFQVEWGTATSFMETLWSTWNDWR